MVLPPRAKRPALRSASTDSFTASQPTPSWPKNFWSSAASTAWMRWREMRETETQDCRRRARRPLSCASRSRWRMSAVTPGLSRASAATSRRAGRPAQAHTASSNSTATPTIAILRSRRKPALSWHTMEPPPPLPRGDSLDFSLSEEQQLLKQSVREFAEKELAPHSRQWDEKQEFPREVFTHLGEMGLMGAVFPPEYGGAGLSTLDYAIV